ncbi:uncharacterized protein L3040_008892 [Drepanopeziza brunnea f. sp. 'multigermtubi']|uniref:AA1-like domain-containing protein n=1 Tax=Marssonina brunnea f. sp. multigermtubi (strain MB_m1) TaxID=1072389 RepID=K1WXI4_MARBU|nr:uncharacterized protein MBM_04824 [Drepanopeziza brunnea f. sp. 'multigermtubi' MB_m1]EKD17247.1 hypothetical protein MBM_04824 [Drepanopeziza brunnea f. sp. 'multigermtubi' MB_m1]KAJ5032285.1 hypothetical protein L3040_008892 [Drepanopeziza brunnea f. sp. 'multigermtubi']
MAPLHFLTSVLLLLQGLTTALPTSSSSKDLSRSPSCSLRSAPTSFTISRFSTFTPSGANTTPAQISFFYSDDVGLQSATCLLKGSIETTTFDAPVLCSNKNISFLFTESVLTVFETYDDDSGVQCVDGTTKEKANSIDKVEKKNEQHQQQYLKGTVYVGTYCYPSPAGVPLGVGTSCQTPSVSLGGSLALAPASA